MIGDLGLSAEGTDTIVIDGPLSENAAIGLSGNSMITSERKVTSGLPGNGTVKAFYSIENNTYYPGLNEELIVLKEDV